jgi:Fe-S cluster biogenesis protein NfuA
VTVDAGPAQQHQEAGPDLRDTGERIERLLDASSAGGIVMRERSEELVRLVVDLYGAGLQRMMEILDEEDHLDDVILRRLADDDLVASLLLVHGLHPEDVVTRVERALEGVRPYLGSHEGDVELVDITDEGVVRLRLLGSCDGCASSSATLTEAVEGAVLGAAPEVTGIEVEPPAPRPGGDRGVGTPVTLGPSRVGQADGLGA